MVRTTITSRHCFKTMWSSPEKPTPSEYFRREHISILENAVQDCLDYDVRSSELYAALDYFKRDSARGVALFNEGLEMRDWTIGQQYMREGLVHIKRNVDL